MKTILISIITLTTFSCSIKGQDTLFFWGNRTSDKTKFNRYEVKIQNANTITRVFYSMKGEKWFKSEFSDSLTIINDSLIHCYYRFYEITYDSTVFRINKTSKGYLVSEYYDNNTLKFSAISKKSFPFEFIGKASKYYRNGNLYANYFYSREFIDSTVYAPKDTSFANYVFSHRIISSLNLDKFKELLIKKINYIRPTESSIISNYIFAICLKNGEIQKYDIIKQTEFEFDNELLKAIEKIKDEFTFSKEINGCILIPLHIDIQ